MRGLDLDVFDFDYDLMWTALFLTADGQVLGRYGSRDPSSLGGLRFALEQALDHFKAAGSRRLEDAPAGLRVEQYAAASRFSATACFHCHHVYEFRREARQAAGTWRREDFYVYPPAANFGLTLDLEQGDLIKNVAGKSPLDRAGLRPGDVLRAVNGQPIASPADVSHALHRAPAQGKILLQWQRDGSKHQSELDLPSDWKVTDLSWRWSMKSLKPAPQVHGDDLTAMEKQALGLNADQLALRLGSFLSRRAQQAGFRSGDVIVGVDGQAPVFTAPQFDVFMRMNYKVGDEVTYRVRRGKEVLAVKIKLSN